VSSVTRCPECGTAFRITGAQLAARGGQARCGRCGAVFDARATLESAADTTPGTARTGAAKVDTRPPRRESGTASHADTNSGWLRDEPSPPARRSTWAWLCASAVAVVLLAAQLAFYFRGEVVLLWPAVKPMLARACATLGCDLPLPHRAELMSIEASDLQADGTNPGIMVLSATLRNRAAFPQQFPSLELTLTNAQDQAVARRVLSVRDYLARGATADAGFAGNSELPVKIFIEAATLKPTGYRLYLFYP
jgi:predicted Zn finger-like uncharacterized protein